MKKNWLHLFLFLATVVTTTVAGAFMAGGEPEFSVAYLVKGVPFSASLLAVLGIHELGHYFASRIHGVNATLPFFIPFPTIIGTFGAFIKIKSAIPDRRSLFDIGFAGPAAGFVVALPVLVIGLILSEIAPAPEIVEESGRIALGDSIIVWLAAKIIYGSIPDGMELWLHPVAFAGWIGLWVTSINLLPIGQLDGGHISYAALGEKAYKVARWVWIALLPLAILWLGWLIWALVILFLIRLRHPPTVYDWIPLDRRRKVLSVVALLVFILTFTPTPFMVS
ncbi:site-2 protease family protein [bacterium]|nr:MAG: site-2 protease family protein [bacterium]